MQSSSMRTASVRSRSPVNRRTGGASSPGPSSPVPGPHPSFHRCGSLDVHSINSRKKNRGRSPVNRSTGRSSSPGHSSPKSSSPVPAPPAFGRCGSLEIHSISTPFNTRMNRFSTRRASDVSLDLTMSSGVSTLSNDFYSSYSSADHTGSYDSYSSFGGNTPSVCTAATGASSKWGNYSVKFRAKNFVGQRQAPFEGVYQLGELLGEGGYGEVYRCWHLESGQERAVKVVNKDPTASKQDSSEVMKEFHILKECDHPNLLKVYEMFEDELNFYIVTDIIKGGELYDELDRCGNFTEADTQILLHVLLSCLNYCHQRGLVHRDLKPENILLEEDLDFHSLKLIDFGLAQTVAAAAEKSTTIPAHLQPQFVEGESFIEGSKYYLAPEVIQGKDSPSSKCDIWATGVIAYVMLSGGAPFDGDTDAEVHSAILDGHFSFDYEVWDDVSDEAKDFVRMLLTYDADARPSAQTMLQHPWLASVRDYEEEDGDLEQRRSSTRESLNDLQRFRSADSKLKQATCAIIASQFLSNEEKEEIDAIFRHLDKSGKGSLTHDDLRGAYRDFFTGDECGGNHHHVEGYVMTDEQIKELIKQVNFSGSGEIEYSEFVIATMMEKNMIDNDKLRAAFSYFDKDNTGYIAAENLKEVLQIDDTHDKAADAYVTKKIIAQVDADGNGKIDFQEFKNMMMSKTVRRMSMRRSSRTRQSVLVHKQSLRELLEAMDNADSSHGSEGDDLVSLLDDSLVSEASGRSISSRRRTKRSSVNSVRRQSVTIIEEEDDDSDTQEEDMEEEEDYGHNEEVDKLQVEATGEEEDLPIEDQAGLPSEIGPLRADRNSIPAPSRLRKNRRCTGRKGGDDAPFASPTIKKDAVLYVTTAN